MLACLSTLCGASARAEPLWVAVGDSGRRLLSRDGLQWSHDQRWPAQTGRLHGIAYGDGTFTAVGERDAKGVVLTTRDGETWQEQTVPDAVEAIAFGRGLFVAAHGQTLCAAPAQGSFPAPPQAPPRTPEAHCRALVAGDTEAGFRFVAIGSLAAGDAGWRAVTSTGLTWDAPPRRAAFLTGLAYGAGHFVAVGAAGLVETSHDGQTWQRQPFPSPDDLNWVTWTGVTFIARGRQTWISEDAFHWRASPQPWPIETPTLAPGAGAVGFPLLGGVLYSADLRTWRAALVPDGPRLIAAACAP